MEEFGSIDIRPYQLLCLICRQGQREKTASYYHESRLNDIQTAIRANPIVPLTLRCNCDSVFRYQNPGRRYDTPEGELYNDLRDLTILQRIGMIPGATLPAIDLFASVFENIPTVEGICAYPKSEAPNWPRCKLADSGNYERGIAKGIASLIPQRTDEERHKVKIKSAEQCYKAKRLRIRPHHLLCMTCFHSGRPNEKLASIEEDNLYECIRAVQQNPDIPVELIRGPCMICPPCSLYCPSTNLCVGGHSMGLRDEKKDLDTLRKIGLRYGDILPARELLNKIYNAIKNTTEICSYGDGVERSREWRVCGGSTGKKSFEQARKAGLGVTGVSSV